MANNYTKILLKRTAETLQSLKDYAISFGECIFVTNKTLDNKRNSYVVVGTDSEDGTVKNAAIFKGFSDINKANSLVFFKTDKKGLQDEDGQQVYADKIVSKTVTQEDGDKKYYILCQPKVYSTEEGHKDEEVTTGQDYGDVATFNLNNEAGIYVTSTGVLHGAAWNDYAENRFVVSFDATPGSVVCENGDGSLSLSTERLQPCPYVVSDTYGMTIGDADHTPVAIAGRALVKVHDEKLKVGDCVCAGVGGVAYVMSRAEIVNYPDRVLGIVTEVPEYDTWNGIKVNGRVWIKVK